MSMKRPLFADGWYGAFSLDELRVEIQNLYRLLDDCCGEEEEEADPGLSPAPEPSS